ncbi:MAG: Gfo/Idh/MocA family oxidoreductase [Anaerolineae bacterium]|nr:MAG: putative oxidoreductase [Chloroflexi bacterium OLB13]MBV6436055.1 Glucose--fructose oxidoreductase [Anaerolineae bacterium]MBW7878678.1 Gfo/Idh/MocA family oxidoreductase [Anaerolineae bacterium]MEB2366127.1 Gfo/Idh/MocA family oxidoreductase [Chloroflexota bacterium]
MTKTLKVGVIGVGGIANTHMPGWAASPHAEVVAGADVNLEALEAWGAKWDVRRLTRLPQDLITAPDIDIIDICTPSNYHADLTIAALDAGKHVICEKPLAPTPAEIQRMIAARDRSGKLLMTAQHHRYQPAAIALKNEVDKGVLGDVYHARAWYLRRNNVPTRPGFVLKAQSGGGACIDIGVHALDTAFWLMGSPEPITVSGISRSELSKQPGAWSPWGGGTPIPPEMDVEELAAGFVRFANGATMMMEFSWALHGPHYEDMQVWLYGTKGGCHYPKAEIYTSGSNPRQQYDINLKYLPTPLEAHALECIDFADAIVNGRPSPVPPEQSLAVIAILDAVYQSAESGREIRMDGKS